MLCRECHKRGDALESNFSVSNCGQSNLIIQAKEV